MPLTRSTEDLTTVGNQIVCGLCSAIVQSPSDGQRTPCGHEFHKTCLKTHLKSSGNCPICKSSCAPTAKQAAIPPAYITRSQSAIASNTTARTTDEEASTSASANRVTSDMINRMQNQIMSTLTEQISKLIEENVEACVSRRGTPQGIENECTESNGLIGLAVDVPPANMPQARTAPLSQGSYQSDLLQRPDKVGHILNGWKLKFTGEGLSIDNFIYRVEALTHQTLEGNFGILCKNASSLFEGKASEFYWRHHKAVGQVRWDLLCEALRNQFRDQRDDADVEDLIRARKQKPNESFEAFYDDIARLIDQMEIPIIKKNLVRILKANLRPEIRHEILHLEINSVSELRDVCRRREAFLEDIKPQMNSGKLVPFRRNIAELVEHDKVVVQEETEEEVGAVALICWNCQQEGHRYQDCLAERRVFCYGCGAAKTYKPNCARCQKNLKGGTPKFPLRQRNSSVQPRTVPQQD